MVVRDSNPGLVAIENVFRRMIRERFDHGGMIARISCYCKGGAVYVGLREHVRVLSAYRVTGDSLAYRDYLTGKPVLNSCLNIIP